MKMYLKITAILMILLSFAFTACGGSGSSTAAGDSVIDTYAIPNVVVPVVGATPETASIDTLQYSGTITWLPELSGTFAASTAYTANIVLTAKTGYTLTGVPANFFTVAGGTATNLVNTGKVEAVFAATGTAADIPVTFSEAAQVGGITNSITTTALTLTFDVDPTSLTADNITVNGAIIGALTGTGTTRNLGISGITAADGGTVTVTITSPAGFAITGTAQTAMVYKAPVKITIEAIPDVVVPVRGAVPVTTSIETLQYTGTITWSPADNLFAATTIYTANIVLTPKTGFTLTGVSADFFSVAGATATNAVNSGNVTAEFPATGAVPDINVIFTGAEQVGGITNSVTTTALTLTFSVDPTSLTTANITLTGATKGALTGEGATKTLAISNITKANGETVSVTITSPAGFAITGSPQTAVVYKAPVSVTLSSITQVGGISNSVTTTALTLTFDVDPTSLTAANIAVTGATKGALTGEGATKTLAISNITKANGETVSVTITNPAGFTITGSPQTAVVYKSSAVVTIAAITGIVAPVTGATPVTTAIDATQYTGTVSWSPANNPFAASTSYTANILLTPKAGYTLTGVTADFFTVAGATATNAVNSGSVAAVFPSTAEAQFVMSGTGVTAGNNQSFTKGTLVFNMKYVPGGTFQTGTDDNGEGGEGGYPSPSTISTPYWMAETEVTYELWYALRTWARAHGYTLNANPGIEGNDGTITVGAGAVPTSAKQEPVTTINWREAMVWCNALTEYYNANNGADADLDCAYYIANHTTPIRSADDSTTITYTTDGSQDMPYVKATAKGFRLPGSMEWECAARYKNGTSWTAGNWASGSTADYTDNVATSLSGVYYRNYTAVSTYTSVTTTAAVKSKNANVLGIRDMSGNVLEWCFDWYPGSSGSRRVLRGGSWVEDASCLQVGYVGSFIPYIEYNYIGFRFVRTQ